MGHELSANAPTAQSTLGNVDREALREARIDLVASLRMAARLGLEEGICNHFSAMVPGRDDLFLVNPYGLMFREVTASSILVCDFEGNVVDGEGQPEATAFFIHAQLHKRRPTARAAFHTHMPYATALSMVEGEPLIWAGQTALKFYGRVAIDDHYNGLALDTAEGDRIAAAMGDADVVFLRNHGVMVTAPTIAMAWDDLYYLERAAEVQIKAMSTGRSLRPVSDELARKTQAQMRPADPDSGRLHLEAVKRQLMRDCPEFAA